jgi:TP901 family phage tail tape measure protein
MDYAINIKLNDLVSRELNKIKSTLNNFTSKSQEIILDVKLKGLEKAKKDLNDLKSIGLSAISAMMTIATPLKQSMDFELQFVDVAKVFNGTDKELQDIKKMIFDIAKTSSASVKDITKITAEGIATGKIPLKDMREFVNLANQSKVAFEVTNDQLGKALNASLSKLQYSVKDTKELFDMLNYSTNISSSKMVDMLNVLSRTAGSLSKFKKEEIATLINFGVEKGVSPEVTATSLNSIMNSLSELDIGKVEKLLKKKNVKIELPKIEGKSISGFEAIEKGYGYEALLQILKQIKNEKDLDMKFRMIVDIFGKGEQKNLIVNFLNDLDGLEKRLKDISTVKNWSNSVTKEFEQVEATALKRIEKFKGLINILMIKIGDSILKLFGTILSFINPILQKIVEFANSHKNLFGVILKVLGLIAIITTVFIAFKIAMIGVTFAFSGFISVLGGLLAVISPIITPLIIISTLIYGFIKYWNEFKSSLLYAIDFTQLNILLEKLSFIKNLFIGLWNIIKLIFGDLFLKIFNFNSKVDESTQKVSFFGELFKIIGYIIGTAINGVIFILNNMLNIIKWILDKVAYMGELFKIVGIFIINALQSPINSIKSIYNWLTNIFSKIKSIISSVSNIKLPNVSEYVSNKWQGFKNSVSSGWSSAKNFLGFGNKNKSIKNNTWNTKQINFKRDTQDLGYVNLNVSSADNLKVSASKIKGSVRILND